ncbi:hypothetical protein N7495_001158 [Penicillium taxi]|uniref:uncharacterized protein n=1 Tax=Penicillium taxi TaxID=168475 RepID=UPI002544F31C|nr:uncharacterized protein N7495_001158 [Penicillium taxi]KAJ5908476.1 hypothetical protein N7495_001158 [Penicillium taxi]
MSISCYLGINIIETLFNPPFRKENQLQGTFPLFCPYGPNAGFDFERPSQEFLHTDLCTQGLDKIYSYLWLAGPPQAAHPLHRQAILGRTILITENPSEHLVWDNARIFIKPLPEYLLNHDFWSAKGDALIQSRVLYESACGLLLSYCWIIRSKSDLAIAHDANLLPLTIKWETWILFVADLLLNINCETLNSISRRYHFGELRLSRLNLIYRLAPEVFSLRNFVRGFKSKPSSSKVFLERNFTWLFSLFGLVSIIASSMQVGLGTGFLQGNGAFQRASVVFTTASLLLVALGMMFIGSIWWFLLFYNITWARSNFAIVEGKRQARG